MTSLSDYMDNPLWASNYNRALRPPNGGEYRRWVQGSSGMMSPMPLWSNEYGFVYMKHGQNNNLPYRGNIKYFSPKVTPELRSNVCECTESTLDPASCQQCAVQKVCGYNH